MMFPAFGFCEQIRLRCGVLAASLLLGTACAADGEPEDDVQLDDPAVSPLDEVLDEGTELGRTESSLLGSPIATSGLARSAIYVQDAARALTTARFRARNLFPRDQLINLSTHGCSPQDRGFDHRANPLGSIGYPFTVPKQVRAEWRSELASPAGATSDDLRLQRMHLHFLR